MVATNCTSVYVPSYPALNKHRVIMLVKVKLSKFTSWSRDSTHAVVTPGFAMQLLRQRPTRLCSVVAKLGRRIPGELEMLEERLIYLY
eukprot:478357-Pyramimonas_sp.AAC.2